MKPNLSYLKFDTEAEAETFQQNCHADHIESLGNDTDYKNSTTRFARIWNPDGEVYWVMRLPSTMQISTALKATLATKYAEIPIVKSKITWATDEVI